MFNPTRAAVTDVVSQVYNPVGARGQNQITSLHVRNTGPNSCYLGGTNAVTDATGFLLEVGDVIDWKTLGADDDLWVICAAAETATLHLLEQT